MIEITENAARQIHKMLTSAQLGESGLRLARKGRRLFGLRIRVRLGSTPRPDDAVFESADGAKVFVDARSLRVLDGTVLDYDTSLLSKGFLLNNPHAKSTCGCGVSFSIEQRRKRLGVSDDDVHTKPSNSLPAASTSTASITDVEQETIPRGLSEDVVRMISAKKDEPEWLLEWRLQAYRVWLTMKEPSWGNVKYGPIDYQNIIYYAAPKPKKTLSSLDEVDPEIRRTFEKLGIPLDEQKMLSGVAVDAVFDSVSVATTFKEKLGGAGHHLLLVLRGRAATTLPSCGSTWVRWCRTRTTSLRR